jgi:hypothetical protein
MGSFKIAIALIMPPNKSLHRTREHARLILRRKCGSIVEMTGRGRARELYTLGGNWNTEQGRCALAGIPLHFIPAGERQH